MLKECIALHSYKGGTGKSTIASNISALLTFRGNNVLLIDMDVYAPTLQTYFDKDPEKWINDFLFNASDFDQVIYNVDSVFDQFIHPSLVIVPKGENSMFHFRIHQKMKSQN